MPNAVSNPTSPATTPLMTTKGIVPPELVTVIVSATNPRRALNEVSAPVLAT